MKHFLAMLILLASFACNATTLHWSGYDWDVRTGVGQPGPNNWSDKNVWVGTDGVLNLRIGRTNNIVSAVCLASKQLMKNGTYTWVVEGPLNFEPNVVLGLFQYPVSQPTSGINEIDIEVSRWGNPRNKNLNYTVWPTQFGSIRNYHNSFELATLSLYTFTYRRSGGAVIYNGGQWVVSNNLATHDYLPVKMNLWLFGGAQNYTHDYVVRIKSFTYVAE